MVDQNSIDELIDNSISVTMHKIIFVGDAGTGKTIIINRIMGINLMIAMSLL